MADPVAHEDADQPGLGPVEGRGVGRRAAVVKFGRLELRGFLGWVFWSLAHIYFLIGLRNRFVVAFNWFWDYITFQRGARLITDVSISENKSGRQP